MGVHRAAKDMNITKALAAAVLAALLFPGCSHQSDSPSASAQPTVIEPHNSVGKIHAGMTMNQVVAALGEPPRNTGKALEYPNLGLAVLPGPDGLATVVMCGDVTGINGPFVKAFTGRTPEGIGMLSTRDDILKAYGVPSEDQKNAFGLESIRYDSLGLSFTLERGKVHHIIVILAAEPGTNQSMRIELAPPAPQK